MEGLRRQGSIWRGVIDGLFTAGNETINVRIRMCGVFEWRDTDGSDRKMIFHGI